LPETRLEKLPRMADFALWVTACETALWPAGTFWAAYCGNRDEAVEGVIEADPIATAVCALMTARATAWTGKAGELLAALAEVAGERVTKAKTWPADATRMGGRLRRAAASLRKVGIEVEFTHEGRGRSRTRTISITSSLEPERGGNSASQASPASPAKDFNDLAQTQTGTLTGGGDANGRGDTPTVCANPLKNKDGNAGDAGDANSPGQSTSEKRWRTQL
jgi:hypothetical protein